MEIIRTYGNIIKKYAPDHPLAAFRMIKAGLALEQFRSRNLADIVKEQGGKAFLTDCNTLYVGSRKNAVDHLETAYMNGFTPYATGCPVIIETFSEV